VAAELSVRDRRVLEALVRVRVLSGAQLERLLFDDIATSARGRIRRRVLGRLVSLGLVATLERRVGGVRAGSVGLVYAPTAAGWRLLYLDKPAGASARRRAPYTPGPLFLAHALAVSVVYVALTEAMAERSNMKLGTFAVEADARWTTADGDVVLRPDALIVLGAQDDELAVWLELDRGTESLPRLRAMLGRYLDFARSGEAGPRGVVPLVVVTAPDRRRAAAISQLVTRLPPPANELFLVVREQGAAAAIVSELVSGEVEKPP
jgi:hypothetical protein